MPSLLATWKSLIEQELIKVLKFFHVFDTGFNAFTHLSQDLKKFAMNYYLLRIFLVPPWEGKRFGTEFLAVRDDKKNDKCQATLTSKRNYPVVVR
jgi:hypothetical protein